MSTAAEPTRTDSDAAGTANLVSTFLATVARLPDAAAARFKVDGQWRTKTWKDLETAARARAWGLLALGAQPGDRINLLGDTTVDWVISEIAVQMVGCVSVPIYQTNGPAEVEYVVLDSGAVLAFVGDAKQLEKYAEIRERIAAVRRVVTMHGASEGAWVSSLDSLVEEGVAFQEKQPGLLEERIGAIQPHDDACFIYTSGTTGPPKGVVLTHSNWAYEARAVREIELVRDDDVQLIFLPLAHSFAQVLKATWLGSGHEMAFAESIDKLVENIAEVRPTVMASVPRIFERVFTRVVSGGAEASGLRGALFRWAMGHFDRYVDARKAGEGYGGLGWALANRLVFSKVAARLDEIFGGRVRYFISGGAPLSPKIAYFFDLAGVRILEGYGLTETSAATTVNRPDLVKIGTVGQPLPGSELRIADNGEILIRGGGVLREYWGQPEATAEALDGDGWFHTGDVGEIDGDGYLTITDRIKDLIVTAGGKNIAPQVLENQLKTHPLISQVMVHGDKRKFLSALVTLDADSLASWAKERGLEGSYAELTRSPEVRAEIQRFFDQVNEPLPRYTTVKKFAILDADFSQEGGQMTPTLKVKRRVVEREQVALLDDFYDEKHD